ncbi:MAG: putative toxin-antitoxin system toxin component, PIN family [Chloroflexi bacterium]|nr:putative toxin-antitoxin system toxin component, PIN family [Chloroflexota bacterium]
MMRVVIDTNVFVSSLFGGNPRKIIDSWKEGTITICLSKDTLDEYVEVLHRVGLDKREIEELLSVFGRGFNSLFTTRTPKIFAVRTDAADNKFIECAVALKAEVIITGDQALRELKEYMDIKIRTPAQFLRE